MPRRDIVSACAAAVDELRASRELIAAQEAEIGALGARLETEKRTTALLAELTDTRRAEAAALRTALDAKSEVITAKQAVIVTQEKLIDTLKAKRPSPWRRIGDILLGAAAIAILK